MNCPTTYSNFDSLRPKNDARRFPSGRVFRIPNSALLFPLSPPKNRTFSNTGFVRGDGLPPRSRKSSARGRVISLVVARETGRRARRSIAVRAALRRRQVRRTTRTAATLDTTARSERTCRTKREFPRARSPPPRRPGGGNTTSRSGPHLGRKRYLRIVLPS